MEFRVLGPIDAVREGAPVALGGPKQRTVLAMLLQAAGRRVHVDELILAVYGEDASSGARRTVQTYVSNLRRELEELIRSSGDGYVLDIPATALDAARFEASFHSAVHELEHEPERAADRLVDALALWRGHPYADIEAHGQLDAEIARLQELRLVALETRIEAELALGRHRELLGELSSLAAEHPFRERLQAHHAVALYRSARQHEALSVVGRTRELLDEELGIDPSPQLQQLELKILRQDPALEVGDAPRIERRTVLVAELDAEDWAMEDRAAALIERDAILESVVERTDASIIGLRGTAVFVAFADTAHGLETAQRLARLGPEARLRVAVDHGDVEVGEDVTGPPVSRVARIVALAHPGQVLLGSDAHAALVDGGLTGWGATALGRHALFGVDESVALYQLQGEGMVDHFPPLRSGRVPPPVPRSSPASVPGYELRSTITEDESSVVHRAYQASVGREVTLRTIRREIATDPAFIRRFEAEGQRIARLTHPNILPLLDYWRGPDGAYLVHPLVDAGDLRHGPSQLGAAPEQALDLMVRVGSALSYAHQHGVLHGQLHPGNVLVDDDQLYVADLGLAQMCHGFLPAVAHAYCAPESLGGGATTVATDVYALGVLAFELLVGRPPPDDEPLPLPEGPLGEVLSRATAPIPEERHPTLEAFLVELQAAYTDAAMHRPRSPVRNPFRGLEAFQEPDAQDFRGREELVTELVQTLDQHRLVSVVGPSGIGKSSVVRAGLLPALRNGAIAGSEGWLFTDMLPGTAPFEELATAVRRVAVDDTRGLVGQLRSSPRGLLRCVERMLPPTSDLLIVIDQFEELFTRTTSEPTRRAFLEALAAAVGNPASRVHLVVTLRADFLDQPLRYASFAESMRPGIVTVPAPTRNELARAVREPAIGVGVEVEDGFVDRIVQDADDEPGGLPLLQHALAECFEARSADALTLEDYETSGGVRGAIGRRAEELYLGLESDARITAREVFLRLVTVDEEDHDTRSRVRIAELSQLCRDESAMHDVVETFARARLLTLDRDPVTRGPTVEVAHESLLHEWDRLRAWIDTVRDDLLTRRRLSAAVREWQDADRDPSFLLRGGRLEVAERWRDESDLPLTDEERDYLAASREAADHEEARVRRRRRRTLTALVGALVITLAFSAVAVTQRGVAQEQERLTRARHLASEARLAVDVDPERGLLLALEALDAHRDNDGQPLPEAVSAVQTLLQASRLEHHLEGGRRAVAVSPDGSLLVTDTHETPGRLRVVDLAEGAEVTSFDVRGQLGSQAISFAPDGSMLAVGYADTDGQPAVETFDTTTWQEQRSYTAPTDDASNVGSVRFTDDGAHLVAHESAANEVLAWDVASGEPTTTIPSVEAMDVVPRSSTLAVVQGQQEVHLVDAHDGETVERLATPGIQPDAVVADPDGARFAVRSFTDRTVEVWDRDSSDRLAAFENPSPTALAWSPTGALVHASNAGTIHVVDDLDDGDGLVLRGHTDGVVGLAFTPDGARLASTSYAEETRVWDIAPGGPAGLGNLWTPDGFIVSPFLPPDENGRAIAAVHLPEEEVRIVELSEDGSSRTLVDGLAGPTHHWAHIAAGGDAAVALDGDLEGRVYDLPDGTPRLTLPACLSPRAISSDGLRIVVDSRLMCTPVDGSVQLLDAPVGEEGGGVFDTVTGRMLVDTGDRVLNWAAFGPPATPSDGLVALLVEWGSVELHDIETGQLVGSFTHEPDLSTTTSFSDDGRYLTVGTQSGRVLVFDVEAALAGDTLEDALVWDLREPTGGVVTATPIANGKLATASMAGHVRVYELADRRLITDLEVAERGPVAAVFARDGSALLYKDGPVIRRLELDLERLAAMARSRLTRGFTAEECETYAIVDDACPAGPGSRAARQLRSSPLVRTIAAPSPPPSGPGWGP